MLSMCNQSTGVFYEPRIAALPQINGPDTMGGYPAPLRFPLAQGVLPSRNPCPTGEVRGGKWQAGSRGPGCRERSD